MWSAPWPKLPNSLSKANAYYGAGNFDEAIALYQQYLEVQPQEVNVHDNLGLAFTAEGRLEEAERALRDVIACKPEVDYVWA